MLEFIRHCLGLLLSVFKSRASLQTENLALRHQLSVSQHKVEKPKVQPVDRILWSLLVKVWTDWRKAFVFVRAETVIRWQRMRFRSGPYTAHVVS
jgi:hypothetical protein